MKSFATSGPFQRCEIELRTANCRNQAVNRLFVPGRIEVLGKHTDYCGGRSITCAIDRGFHVCFVPSGSAEVTLHALDLKKSVTFHASAELCPALGWANYPMAVVRRLCRNFPGSFEGVRIAFTSSLPQAAGMSSSSALVVATYLALDRINGFTERARRDAVLTTPLELAEYLGTLENGQSYRSLNGDLGVGTFGGSEDHTAITLARAGHVSLYHYAPTRLDRHIALPPDYQLAIATSGVIAEKTGAARERYNRAALLARRLVELWLRHHACSTPQTLASIVRSSTDAADVLRDHIRRDVADPTDALALLRRLDHFIAESETIIPGAASALERRDLIEFGRAVDESQKQAQFGLQNQVPETVTLAGLARECGALAASSFGAGFGGSVWALVHRADSVEFIKSWSEAYAVRQSDSARHASFFTVEAVDGTTVGDEWSASPGRSVGRTV